MTRDEAQHVVEVIASVDGYCRTCAGEAAEALAKRDVKVTGVLVAGVPFDWQAAVEAALDAYWNAPG